MNTALLLVDIQNDYFPDGKMELTGSVEAAAKAWLLLDAFRRKNLPVIHVQHISVKEGASFFLPGTDGIKFYSSVQPVQGELFIQKHFPNSFRNTPLLNSLKSQKVQNLVICGMMTHMCIDATTRAAVDFGFDCIVASDACATKSLVYQGVTISAEHVHLSFLAALNSAYAKIICTDEIIKTILNVNDNS